MRYKYLWLHCSYHSVNFSTPFSIKLPHGFSHRDAYYDSLRHQFQSSFRVYRASFLWARCLLQHWVLCHRPRVAPYLSFHTLGFRYRGRRSRHCSLDHRILLCPSGRDLLRHAHPGFWHDGPYHHLEVGSTHRWSRWSRRYPPA